MIGNRQHDYIGIDTRYQLFLSAFNTAKPKYKIPPITKGYRQGMNPIDVLYQKTQAVMLVGDNGFCEWMLDLFHNKEWMTSLLNDIDVDCTNIHRFINVYPIKNKCELDNLIRTYDNFIHYKKTFASLTPSSACDRK